MKERILEYCDMTFTRYGIRSVSMDAIAVGLGISKKTIYQYFADKEEIIKALFEKHYAEETQIMEQIRCISGDPVEKFIRCIRYFNNELASMNPAMLYDLKKYHPEVWESYCIRKENDPVNMVKDILTEGIEKGLFRPDLNIKLLTRMLIRMMDLMADGISFPQNQFKLTDVHTGLMLHFLYGLATETGHQMIEHHKPLLTQDPI